MRGKPEGTPEGPVAPRGDADTGTSVGEFAGLGLQFAASIVLFLYLGQWLDRKLGTEPWLLLTGVFVGAGGSFYSLYHRLMKAQAREEAAKAAKREQQREQQREEQK